MISSYLVVFKRIAVKLFLVGVVIGLTACGGDDDKKTPPPTPVPTQAPTPAPDTTPGDFSFTLPQQTYKRGAVATTDPVTITEIDTLTNIFISAGGEYSIDSGSFTSSAGQIANNQTLVARATAGSNFGDEVEITVTVGMEHRSFKVKTEAQDLIPDELIFTSVTGATLNTEYTSNTITISGINDSAPVTIAGGEYSINSGAYSADAGTIESGDTVSVRLTSAATANTAVEATLNVGDSAGVFSVKTIEDTQVPVVELYFPTQMGITDKATLRVRGVASDDLSGVTSVTVNGVNVETSDDYATWQATIDLALGENDITLIAQDGSGNTTASQVFATITRSDDLTGAYNVVDENLDRLYGLQFIESNQQLFVMEDRRNYYFVNPETGALTLASAAPDPDTINEAANGRSLTSAYYNIAGEEGVYVGGNKGIYRVNLETGERELLTDVTFPDNSLDFDQIYNMDIYAGNSLEESYLLVANDSDRDLVKINIQTGEKSLFSDNTDTGLGEPIVGVAGVEGIDISTARNIAYVTTGSAIYTVDLIDEIREIVATNDIPNDIHKPWVPVTLLDDESELCGVAADGGYFMSCLDLTLSGDFQKRVISESVPPGLDGIVSAVHLAEHNNFYMSSARGIGVTDMVTGEHIVLMKPTN